MKAFALALVMATILVGCSSGSNSGPAASTVSIETTLPGPEVDQGAPVAIDPVDQQDTETTSDQYPDVIEVVAVQGDDSTWRFDVTISSPYDSPSRYADAFRVTTTSGEVLGVRELAHDHASEQPFTRSLTGVVIESSVDEVIVEGRDQANGWGGEKVVASLTSG